MLVTYSSVVDKALQVEQLRAENELLRDYTTKVRKLEADLRTNRMVLRKMMELAGIESDDLGAARFAGIETDSNLTATGGADVYAGSSGGSAAESDTNRHVPNLIPMDGTVSRGYAPGNRPGQIKHLGIDIAGREASPVFAAGAGIVEFSGWDEHLGNMVIIDHQNGYKSHYGHNRASLVTVGDEVGKGELIALSGNTGNSSAPHLHFEIRLNGKSIDPGTLIDVNRIGELSSNGR